MNLNSNQAVFTIPVFCKDQTADIRNIEAAANKALQNIHSLYDKIMAPKAPSYADYGESLSDYSSDSASVSICDKNGCHSVPGASKPFSEELCGKCQKLVSQCSSCHKLDLSNTLKNHHQSQNINKRSLQMRSNSCPGVNPVHRKSSYRPEQKISYHQDQHALRNAPQIQEKYAQRNSHTSEEMRRKSQHPVEGERNYHYSKECRRNSHHQRKFSCSSSVQKEQNVDRDFHHQERSSHYPESSSVTHSEYNDYSNYTFKSLKESNIQFSITVPKPFSLTAENIKRQQVKEEKISKLREEINNQIEKELSVKFSPKPVPKHVNLPLYGEMVKMNEKRKKERKEKCIEILNEKTKPFNLSVGASKSTSDLSQDESKTFKAKPVPKNILSENISLKLKDKEEARKLLIAQRAEKMLRMSSSPFSPKPIQRSHSLFNISNSPAKSNINVTKEKIEAITKRLYSIKCQETIENWNNKILQNDLWDVETSSYKKNWHKNSNDSNEKQKLSKSALPFHNFPVRMTNATFLREKRIRTDIEMRKKREETDESIRDEIARKRKEILKNIWPRLKSAETVFNIGKEIEEKVKGHRESQKNREQEYEKELEDMMKRVSKQFLLIERQSKEFQKKLADPNGNVREVSEKEPSSGEDENESLKEVESPSSSASVESDSPTPSVSEKSDSPTPSASEKSDSPTPSASEKSDST